LVGSTAFKQSNQLAFDAEKKASLDKPVEPWLSPIAHFYREVERLFAKHWAQYNERTLDTLEWPAGDAPQLWKSAGDELLYVKVLKDHREALTCIFCWVETLREYRLALRSKYPALDIKSAAWIAGFPITNTEVIFRSSVEDGGASSDDDDAIFSNLKLLHEYYDDPSDKRLTRDFIGPSIDTGFRVCSLASPRKLVITIDLMLLIVHAIRTVPPELNLDKNDFHYHGRETLKGVFGGFGYPIFWLDMAHSSELERVEDRLLNLSPRNTDDIKKFCEQFIAENPNRIIVPYISGNGDKYFDNPPPHHNERLRALKSYYENEANRRLEETNSAKSTNEDGADADEDRLLQLIKMLLSGTPGDPEHK